MSRIRIEGETEYAKDIIERGVRNAVIDRLNAIKKEIQEINKDLDFFRRKYDLADEIFLESFKNGDLGDDEDYFAWEGSLQILARLEEEQSVLREAL
jgi:hypothetical protein